MEFETGRRSTLARLQLSVQGLAGSLNSAKKVLVASTVLTAAFCGAIFGLTLVANEASKESHVTNGLLTTVDGDIVNTKINKGLTPLAELSALDIAKQDFVSFSQDGADRFMQILGVQATVSKKVINTIVGAFEVTEEGMTFAGDNVVLEASEADKAARKAQCKFCTNARSAQCSMCSNTGRSFLIAGRNPLCAICSNQGRSFQCLLCTNGRSAQCAVCTNGRSNMCKMCTNGRNGQCVFCTNGRNVQCKFCANARSAQKGGGAPGEPNCAWNQEEDEPEWFEGLGESSLGDSDSENYGEWNNCISSIAAQTSEDCGGAVGFDVTGGDAEANISSGIVNVGSEDFVEDMGGSTVFTLCTEENSGDCYGE